MIFHDHVCNKKYCARFTLSDVDCREYVSNTVILLLVSNVVGPFHNAASAPFAASSKYRTRSS